MTSLKTVGIVGLPVIVGLVAFLEPKLKFAGVGREVPGLNNDRCTPIPGLQGCEDAWVHEGAGLAYLACSTKYQRSVWFPPLARLNATALPTNSEDTLVIYDFSTNSHSPLALTGLPKSFPGLFTHGIEVFQQPSEPETLVLFVVSHRPPASEEARSKVHKTGANSVVEIFETTLGSKEARWIKTVEHTAIRTPNNIAAVGRREFYFSNDHKRKVHWLRELALFYGEPTDISWCDASGETPICSIAADGLRYPNGVMKGAGDTLWSALTLSGKILLWEIQADHTLFLQDEIPIDRPIDNMIRSEATGDVYVAAFPSALQFTNSAKPAAILEGKRSPVEAWKISREQGEAQYYGHKWSVEKVFSDSGDTVSGSTTAASYKNRLLLTGPFSEARVCILPQAKN